jgi:hypothetical protein
MDNDIDVLDELEVSLTPKRSNFLTVLCILTWIGSGGAILYYGYEYALMTQFTHNLGLSGATKLSWITIILFVSALTPLLTLAGSILMWRLRKWGFYIYVAGQAIPAILSFYVAIGVNGVRGPSLIFAILWCVIPIGFVVMYALNFRNLR